jgi:glycosyltransferase involved in cell wall biosynthesis
MRMKIKNGKPFFSIVTCTYNSQGFIKENLTSVGKQNFNDIEHIFVDGESKDNTPKILASYKKKQNYPVRIINAPPLGISNAFNIGIKNSTGRYIYILNSDDNLHDRNVFYDVSNILNDKPELDWIYAKIQVKDDKGNKIGTFPNHWFLQKASARLLKYVNFIPHQATFMKKEVFEKYGEFDENLKASMDTDYWLRIANKTSWKFFDRVIATYLARKGARTSDMNNRNENRMFLYKVKKRHLNCIEFKIFKLIYTRVLMERSKAFLQR